jgi:hypothetical protein
MAAAESSDPSGEGALLGRERREGREGKGAKGPGRADVVTTPRGVNAPSVHTGPCVLTTPRPRMGGYISDR